jgi:hypothetical protein
LISAMCQRQTGAGVNAKCACRTPNAHSTSFRTASCKAEKAICVAVGLDARGTVCTKHRHVGYIPSANTYPKLCLTLSIEYTTFGGHLPVLLHSSEVKTPGHRCRYRFLVSRKMRAENAVGHRRLLLEQNLETARDPDIDQPMQLDSISSNIHAISTINAARENSQLKWLATHLRVLICR